MHSRKIAFAILLTFFAGCGSKNPWSGPEKRRTTNDTSDKDKENGKKQDNGTPQDFPLLRNIPVETFIIGTKGFPSRIKAQTIKFQFRSNISNAVFECQTSYAGKFGPCSDSNSYTILSLVHGQAYYLAVRAKTPAGTYDKTPAQVSFIADLYEGKEPFKTIDLSTVEPIKAQDLPVEVEENQASNNDNPLLSRQVQVGSYYYMVVPYNMHVASYSTSKTYNAVLRMLRVIGDSGRGSAYEGDNQCNKSWERPVEGAKGYEYCEATPARSQLYQAYANPMPYNHVELVRGDEAESQEKILVAAFDNDADPAENRLGISSICAGARAKGASSIPALNEFFDIKPERETFLWCQVMSSSGEAWWVGAFNATLKSSDPATAPRIKVIYSINATKLGIVSGQQFSSRATALLPQLIVPMSPVVN